MKFSLVVGYRNRDLDRVKRYLNSVKSQTVTNFELIFVDYGSDEPIAAKVKQLVNDYKFAKYIYNCTIGWSWNRSHALNTGLRIAKGEIIIFSDIDLIYSDNFLEHIAASVKENHHFYQQVFWLPKNYNYWEKLLDKPLNFEASREGAKGGVHVASKEYLDKLQGYDEFYCFWGLEDHDLYDRLLNFGIKEAWLEKEKSPVYHQWHPIVSNEKKNFFPEKWYDDMLTYYAINKKNLIRNNTNWGKLYTASDRPIFQIKSFKNYPIPSKIVLNTKSTFYQDLIKQITELKNGEGLSIDIPLPKEYNKYSDSLAYKILQKLLKVFRLESVIVKDKYIKNLEYLNGNDAYLIPEKDIYYLVWKLIKTSDLIKDFELLNNGSTIKVNIC